MPKTPKLSDIQLLMLSTASQRDDGNLLPFAESVKTNDSRLTKAIQSLVAKGLVAESEANKPALTWRQEDDRRIGLVITGSGREAIAVEPVGETPKAATSKPKKSRASRPSSAKGEIRPGTKQAKLGEMLEREGGATIQEIVDATGWLPHTTRAALTGLRKRGWQISAAKEEGVSRYRGRKATA